MSLINCEIPLQLTCSKKGILTAGTAANQLPKFRITNTKFYIPVATLSTQENIKPLKQLESGFKRTLNWNKYHSQKSSEAQNKQLNVLIDPGFQGVYRIFVLSFQSDDGRKSWKQCYLPTVEIIVYKVAIDGKKIFSQPVKNDLKTYDIIKKIRTGQGDDYKTGCLLDYIYFKNTINQLQQN